MFPRWSCAVFALLLGAASPREDAARHLAAAQKAHQAQLAAQSAAMARAALASAEADRLAGARVAAAAGLRQTEAAVLADRASLGEARRASAEADANLARLSAALGTLLPVMLRLSLYPDETMLASGVPPEQAVAGTMIAGGLAVQVQRDAAAWRAARAQAAMRAREVGGRADILGAAEARQQAQAAALDAQIAAARLQAAQQSGAAVVAAQRAADLAAQAQSLQGALQALAVSARTRPPPRVGGALLLVSPVAGPISAAWGAPSDAGPTTGLSFTPTPRAYVVSPCNGVVAFAAPFRSYGKLVIVDCGGGFAAVLGGMDRLQTAPGARLRAGEPLGIMPAAHPSLYLELRRAGAPVDPAPFLRAKR